MLVARIQFLDRGLHPAGFRLIEAGELHEQAQRRVGTRVAGTRSGDMLCIADGHVERDAGVNRAAAAEDEIDIPALCRTCAGRQGAGRWIGDG